MLSPAQKSICFSTNPCVFAWNASLLRNSVAHFFLVFSSYFFSVSRDFIANTIRTSETIVYGRLWNNLNENRPAVSQMAGPKAKRKRVNIEFVILTAILRPPRRPLNHLESTDRHQRSKWRAISNGKLRKEEISWISSSLFWFDFYRSFMRHNILADALLGHWVNYAIKRRISLWFDFRLHEIEYVSRLNSCFRDKCNPHLICLVESFDEANTISVENLSNTTLGNETSSRTISSHRFNYSKGANSDARHKDSVNCWSLTRELSLQNAISLWQLREMLIGRVQSELIKCELFIAHRSISIVKIGQWLLNG